MERAPALLSLATREMIRFDKKDFQERVDSAEFIQSLKIKSQ